MRILVFSDDTFHPVATVRTGLEPLSAEFGFDWVEDATDWDPGQLAQYDVAVLSKSNVRSANDKTPWLTGSAQGIFQDYVRRGGGLVAVHSGTASYKDVAPVRAVLGGVFISHPPPCEVTLEPLAGHPLTAGVTGPFTVTDEHYQMVIDDPKAEVFLHSRSMHGLQPAGWTRTEERGRVCVLTPGHSPEVWLHPSFQRLLTNAIRWVTPALSDPNTRAGMNW